MGVFSGDIRLVLSDWVTNYIHLIDLKQVNRQNSYLKQLNTPFYYEIHAESYMLNKNSLAVKKCEANQKPQWL